MPTATEVFQQLITGISEGRWADLGPLYAKDAVVLQPFFLGAPLRIDGRDDLAARFAAAATMPLELRATNIVVHETTDPDTIVAEFDYDGRNSATGRTFRVANIQVLTVKDGLITATRDYHDHPRLAEALAS
jgi:ketosteroid isomerase-like protein